MDDLMKDNYYVIVEKKGSKISLLNLYDNINRLIYCGETKIKDDFFMIESNPSQYFDSPSLVIIPLNKGKFDEIMDSDLSFFKYKSYKKFIIKNDLAEWYI